MGNYQDQGGFNYADGGLMPFDKVVADQVLAKCGRHCCLCRRFRPTWLQVHHIEEESKGGESNKENAIALCVTCHIDVHTKRPFTQRFSSDELVQHRDQVFRLVEDGKLCGADETLEEFVIGDSNFQATTDHLKLSTLALKILVSAAEREDCIMLNKYMGGSSVQAGAFIEEVGHGRKLAEVEAALEELEYAGLVKQTAYEHGGIWQITLMGYQLADTASAMISLSK